MMLRWNFNPGLMKYQNTNIKLQANSNDQDPKLGYSNLFFDYTQDVSP
jgi:hypothetical protein